MGETRVDLLHLLKDLRDAYPGPVEETILTEIVANALDSGASAIEIVTDSAESTLTVVDNGVGMSRKDLRQYHDIAATTKTRGRGIGFAGVGIKLGLLVSDEVFTETRRDAHHIATTWRLSSKRRAPWNWTEPAGLVEARGTAVQLKAHHALSPLVDAGYLEQALYHHFEPLFDPTFEALLSQHYPDGVTFVVNGRRLASRVSGGTERALITVKLPRKHKPSALGFLVREDEPLREERRGVAISTYGKVIKRGWDWLGITPAYPETVGGLIEAPQLAKSLTLNKADFIRVGANGAPYVAYRKAIQEAVAAQLAEWGIARERPERERPRATRPLERDLERVLLDLADEFPLLSTLMERRAGGQRRLPIGTPEEKAGVRVEVGGPMSGHEATAEGPTDQSEPTTPAEAPKEPAPPPSSVLDAGVKGPRRPTRYRLRIQFEQRPGTSELSRLVQSTVWVNESHPAYQRATASRATGYHIALATAMALAKVAVEASEERDFITAFLVRWGKATQRKPRRKTRRGKAKAKAKH